MKRRSFLGCLGAAASSGLISSQARATLLRGLSLEELVGRSAFIVVLSALDSESHYLDIGGRRSIVTDTRVRIEDVLAKALPQAQELVVRTLGGRVGDVGELVHGQPALSLGSPDVAFLKLGADGAHWFVGMAQGHYPLTGATPAEIKLSASAQLPDIRDYERCAVRRLRGSLLSVATRMVREAAGQ